MITCGRCNADLPDDARFCSSCGAPVVGPQPAEMLKLATILFADVVGSTQLAESAHPEDVRDLMSAFFVAMAEEITAEGGTVEKYIGDAVMAVFGVPAAHEDDPERAVKAALRMNARVIDFNSELPSKPLRLRIGINTGEVLAGAPGPDLMVTGDAVNVAARLQGAASPGQIVVSERTARAVRDSFFFTPLDAQQLAGRSAPVRAFLDSLGRRNDVGTAR